MPDPGDWRLAGQERYLKGVEVCRWTYRQDPKNAKWDHDHCSFCWAKFSLDGRPQTLREGWSTLDEYHWICDRCFADFKELFEWHVVDAPSRLTS
ncbi:MAG: hypothetical protein L0216_10555 [Planctomycetales bacterium]|nr:hypothetical protein [Planctomycetales bacterium]